MARLGRGQPFKTRPSWPTVGRIVTAYTLTASAGAYGEAGVAATLKSGRKLTASAGAYVESGVAAGLAFGHKLTAAAGAYAEAGVAAGLLATRRLTAAAGAYALAGNPATLVKSGAAVPISYWPGIRWVDKPPRGSLVNTTHPQAAGLKFLALLNENGGPPFDLIGRQKGVTTGAPAWGGTVEGIGRSGYATTAFDAYDGSQFLGVTYPFWLAVLFVNTGTGDYVLASQVNLASANPLVEVRLNTGASAGVSRYNVIDGAGASAAASTAAGATASNNGKPHLIMGVSYTPSDHRLYFDGLQVATNTTTVGALTATNFSLGVRRRLNAPTNGFVGGSLILVAAGNGLVPNPARLASDPYAFLAPPASRRVISFAVGYRLTAAAGSFSETGVAATLKVGHAVTAVAGAYVESGVAATLKAARKLTAATGAYAVSGNPASLIRPGHFTFTASAGAFALAGNPATLKAARKLTSAAGAYVESGNAATVRPARRIISAAGAYHLAGQDAALHWSGEIVDGTGPGLFTAPIVAMPGFTALPLASGQGAAAGFTARPVTPATTGIGSITYVGG